jgi:hypothetical protein
MSCKGSVIALGAVASLLVVGDVALAVIGRPLMPLSVAGVARRTVRRTAAVAAAVAVGTGAVVAATATTAAATTAAAADAAAATADVLTELPPGCVVDVDCYGAVYAPEYQGTTIIYVRQ